MKRRERERREEDRNLMFVEVLRLEDVLLGS